LLVIRHTPFSGFLECIAWVGTGLAWSVCGGVLSSRALGGLAEQQGKADFTFAQISDSHIGFAKEPNILHAAKNEAGLNVWKLWVIKEFSFSR
jgi:Icc protein